MPLPHATPRRDRSGPPDRCALPGIAVAIAAAAATIFIPPVRAGAVTYYVSPTGRDSNNGSAAFPFRQIRRALQVVAPGGMILVADGSYLGFDVTANGAAGFPITIKAMGANANVMPTSDRADNRDTIKITYASWIVIDGLHAFNANRAAVRIDSSPNVTVRNGVFGNNTTWGIFTDFSDDTLLQDNQCYGSVQQHGIYVSNSSQRPIIRHNLCYNNHDCGIHVNADASQGGSGLTLGALIEKNILHDNGAGGGSAINLDGVQNSTVVNNLVFNNHATGIGCFQINGAAGPQGMSIYHNTVDMPAAGRWALMFTNTTGRNTVRNNILLNANANHGGLQCGNAADAANVDSDYNVQDRVTDGASVYTLANWKSMGHELQSLSASAASLFVSPGVDYHLLASAPAVDHGQTLAAVTVDLDGDPRPIGATSDIGCDEFAGGVIVAAPAPPTNLTAAAGNAQVTLNWAASAGATSYTVLRASISGGPYQSVTSVVVATTFTDGGVINGTTYYYVVQAANAGGTSPNSAQVAATPSAAVAVLPPTGLRAGVGTGQVVLAWSQSATAAVTQNRIYRANVSGGPYALLATITARQGYADASVVAGKTYYYVVTALTAAGTESAYSNQAAATAK